MDHERLAAAQAELVAWGLVETGPPVRLSRRGQAAMARAAAWLRQEELAGRAAQGHPMVLAAEVAVGAAAPEGARATPDHHRLLAAIELAGLPDGVRGLLSGPDAPRPGGGLPGPGPPAT